MAVEITVPTGNLPIDWGGFYNDVYGGIKEIQTNQTAALNRNQPGKFPSFDSLQSFLQGSGSGSAGTNEEAKTSGAGVASGPGAGLGLLEGNWIARVAIIVLGFIFVAVGLSMFKDNVINVVTGKV